MWGGRDAVDEGVDLRRAGGGGYGWGGGTREFGGPSHAHPAAVSPAPRLAGAPSPGGAWISRSAAAGGTGGGGVPRLLEQPPAKVAGQEAVDAGAKVALDLPGEVEPGQPEEDRKLAVGAENGVVGLVPVEEEAGGLDGAQVRAVVARDPHVGHDDGKGEVEEGGALDGGVEVVHDDEGDAGGGVGPAGGGEPDGVVDAAAESAVAGGALVVCQRLQAAVAEGEDGRGFGGEEVAAAHNIGRGEKVVHGFPRIKESVHVIPMQHVVWNVIIDIDVMRF